MNDTPAAVGADIARSLANIEKNIKAAKRDIAKDGAKVSREELYTAAKRSAGSDRRYSNFKGPALGVKARYDADGVRIIPTGPWKIPEEGADPHGGHPGTRRSQGKQAWTRGRDAAVIRLDRSVQNTLDEAVDEGFRRA